MCQVLILLSSLSLVLLVLFCIPNFDAAVSATSTIVSATTRRKPTRRTTTTTTTQRQYRFAFVQAKSKVSQRQQRQPQSQQQLEHASNLLQNKIAKEIINRKIKTTMKLKLPLFCSSLLTTSSSSSLCLLRATTTSRGRENEYDTNNNNEMDELLNIGGDPAFFLNSDEMNQIILDTTSSTTIVSKTNNNNNGRQRSNDNDYDTDLKELLDNGGDPFFLVNDLQNEILVTKTINNDVRDTIKPPVPTTTTTTISTTNNDINNDFNLDELEAIGGDPFFVVDDPNEIMTTATTQFDTTESSTTTTTTTTTTSNVDKSRINIAMDELAFDNSNELEEIGGDPSFLNNIILSRVLVKNNSLQVPVLATTTTNRTNTDTIFAERSSTGTTEYENTIYELEEMGGDLSFFLDPTEFTKGINTTIQSIIITTTSTGTENNNIDNTAQFGTTGSSGRIGNQYDILVDELDLIGGDPSFIMDADEMSTIISQTLVGTITNPTNELLPIDKEQQQDEITAVSVPKWEWDGIVDEEAHLGFL